MAFLEREGVGCPGQPTRAPNCNAYAERFVRSIKEECLDYLLVLGERHLQRAIAECVAHYHAERNHQGHDNELIQPLRPPAPSGAVRRRPRMGGMLNCLLPRRIDCGSAVFLQHTRYQTGEYSYHR